MMGLRDPEISRYYLIKSKSENGQIVPLLLRRKIQISWLNPENIAFIELTLYTFKVVN